MKKHTTISLAFVLVGLLMIVLASSAQASPSQQDNILAHGKYIASIAGCIDCHTPFREEFQDPANMTLDQLKLFSFNLGATQDLGN